MDKNLSSQSKLIGYYSLEYALNQKLPIYAGGLGVLSADYLLESANSTDPNYVFLGIFYLDDTKNEPENAGFRLLKDEYDEPIWLDVDIGVRPVFAKVWTKEFGNSRLFLFDTNVSSNEQDDRDITKNLYDSDQFVFIKQQLVLAIASIKLFQRLKMKPDVYHLNEGHTAMVILALIIDLMDTDPTLTFDAALTQVREKCVGTKHTILHGAGRDISKEDFRKIFEHYAKRHKLNLDEIFAKGVNETVGPNFSTTNFLMQNTRIANCVSKLHCNFEIGIHPHSKLIPITNGVNLERWQVKNLRDDAISDSDLWKAHLENKSEMIKSLNLNLKTEPLTIVWARRLAEYKRPLLLFNDIDRLEKLLNNTTSPLQIIVSGRPNKNDEISNGFANELEKISKNPKFAGKVVYLPEYNLEMTHLLVCGSDLWLNTPKTRIEACGTSGMKAGTNGSLVFSTIDGWVGENEWKDIGWILPEFDIEKNIYTMLEEQIVTEYYKRENGLPIKWIKRMQETMKIIETNYSTKRMMEDYIKDLYWPKI